MAVSTLRRVTPSSAFPVQHSSLCFHHHIAFCHLCGHLPLIRTLWLYLGPADIIQGKPQISWFSIRSHRHSLFDHIKTHSKVQGWRHRYLWGHYLADHIGRIFGTYLALSKQQLCYFASPFLGWGGRVTHSVTHGGDFLSNLALFFKKEGRVTIKHDLEEDFRLGF